MDVKSAGQEAIAKEFGVTDLVRKLNEQDLRAVQANQKAEENNKLLDRYCFAVESVMAVEAQKGRQSMTRHGAYVVKSIEALLQGLYDHDHVVMQPPFMSDTRGPGFVEAQRTSLTARLDAAGVSVVTGPATEAKPE